MSLCSQRLKLHKTFGILLVLTSWIVNTIEESRGPGYDTSKLAEDGENIQKGSVPEVTDFDTSVLEVTDFDTSALREEDSIWKSPVPSVTDLDTSGLRREGVSIWKGPVPNVTGLDASGVRRDGEDNQKDSVSNVTGLNSSRIRTEEGTIQKDSLSSIIGLDTSGIRIEGDSILRNPVPKITHTFFAKLNSGLFVQRVENKTATPAKVTVSTTGRFPVEEENTVVVFKGVENITTTPATNFNQSEDTLGDQVDSDEADDRKAAIDKNDAKSLARSELHNRESMRFNFQEPTGKSDGCSQNSCSSFQDTESNAETFFREALMDTPKVSVRMFMPPADHQFYLTSNTLQDLWQNHINAESIVPLDIVDTAASDLIEYYLPPPDPNFVVPVMTTSSPNAEQGFVRTSLPQGPLLGLAVTGQRLPKGPSFPYSGELLPQAYPTAIPAMTEQVLPRPPPLYSFPSASQDVHQYPAQTIPSPFLQGLPVPKMHMTPSAPVRYVVSQPPQYRNNPQNIHNSYLFPQVQQPALLNQTLLSMGINNIGKVPPSFVIHTPANIPTLQLINAIGAALPGIMQQQGVGSPQFTPTNVAGGQIRFPGQNVPMELQPTFTSNGGVMVTPHSERRDPVFSSDVDDSGDTRVIIRLRTSPTAKPARAASEPDNFEYSELTLDNGQTIQIRIEGDQDTSPSPQHSTTKILPPQTTTQSYIQPHLQLNRQVVTPVAFGVPKRILPFRRRPADDRFSIFGLPDIKGSIGQLFNKGGSGNSGNMYNSGSSGNSGSMYNQGGSGNSGSMYNQGGSGNSGSMYNQGGSGNSGSMYNQGGSGNSGNMYNNGGSGNSGSMYNNGGQGNKGGLFNKGGLENIINQLKKNNPFNKGGFGNIGNQFSKGSISDITGEISNSVNQVKSKFQQLVRPLQTQVDSSFDSAVGFLQMLFGSIIPGNYYENVLTVLAIVAFLAFVHVRISLMFNSLGPSITFGFLGKAEEVLNTIKESDQIQVIEDLASDVYISIERWAEDQLGLPSSWTSDLLFVDKISSFFNSVDSKDTDDAVDSADSKDTDDARPGSFVRKTLYDPSGNESMPTNHENENLNLRARVIGEIEGVASLGSTMVDLTWNQGANYSSIAGSSCLQRPLCDLNTKSDKDGGLSGLIIPLVSTGLSWAARPPDDVFSVLDTFRPLWLSNTHKEGEGCRRIHTCNQLT